MRSSLDRGGRSPEERDRRAPRGVGASASLVLLRLAGILVLRGLRPDVLEILLDRGGDVPRSSSYSDARGKPTERRRQSEVLLNVHCLVANERGLYLLGERRHPCVSAYELLEHVAALVDASLVAADERE